MPIIITAVNDPVGLGIVSSLEHPGGNVTGTTIFAPQLIARRLEILGQLDPDLTRVAMVLNGANANNPLQFEILQNAAEAFGVEAHAFDVRSAEDLDSAFASMQSPGVQGLLNGVDSLINSMRGQLGELASQYPASGGRGATIQPLSESYVGGADCSCRVGLLTPGEFEGRQVSVSPKRNRQLANEVFASVAPRSLAVAFYRRVSNDELKERGTIENQRHYLFRKYDADLAPDSPQPMTLVGDFADDGVSGAIPFRQRPQGQRLLDLCRAGAVRLVIVTKLDRLGRTARVLLDAHDELAACGVAIASATEPFDTRTSIGRFLFQLLASIAELERETIRERMTLGRDRVAREGKFVNGPVPFGYAVDDDGFLVASERHVAELGITEAELVRELFRRVAEGETSVRIALWLKAAGVRATRRYFSRKTRQEVEREDAVAWSASRVCRTIGNPVYRGIHTIKSAYGHVQRTVVPLVAPEIWARANAQLTRNQEQAFGGGRLDNFYLLRQLIVCENCSRHYVGQAQSRTLRMRLYRCNGTAGAVPGLQRGGRCNARSLPADLLERRVWERVSEVVCNPGPYLEALRRQVRERKGLSVDVDERRRPLAASLVEKEQARQRVLELNRRGRITLDEADAELTVLGAETAELRRQIELLDNDLSATGALERSLVDGARLLSELHEELDDIERSGDNAARRFVVEKLVSEISVLTLPSAKRIRRPYRLVLKVRFADPARWTTDPKDVGASRSLTTTSRRSSPTGGPTATSGLDDELRVDIPIDLPHLRIA